MRVVVTFGSRRGQVVDLLPDAARAMLADGRARPVEDDADGAVVPPVAVPADRMADAEARDPVSRPTATRRRRR